MNDQVEIKLTIDQAAFLWRLFDNQPGNLSDTFRHSEGTRTIGTRTGKIWNKVNNALKEIGVDPKTYA